jgi:putative transposase
MPRRSRFSTAGYVFHVLNRAVARQSIFQTEGDYDAFVSLLEEAREKVSMRRLAYVVMPNHWHLVLWPESDDALSEYMRWLSVTHAQRWHTALLRREVSTKVDSSRSQFTALSENQAALCRKLY